jgi:hypothetical protein
LLIYLDGKKSEGMRLFCALLVFISLFLTAEVSCNQEKEKSDTHQLWLKCNLEQVISFDIFNTAFTGYEQYKNLNNKNILTIIDFSRPSTEKRFFVIDLENKRLLFHCLVAHGKNSGDTYAVSFSNVSGSLESSLGFYRTAETYYGDHGYSLKLDGLEKGLNDNARAREIVIHGASYVSDEFISKYGRLGRSWGCPAIPETVSKEIIDKISGGSCLYIYGKDESVIENKTNTN